MTPLKPAQGVTEGLRVKIAVSMPADLFRRIRDRATANGTSFNREAVELLSCGLFDYEESEAHDPPAEPIGHD